MGTLNITVPELEAMILEEIDLMIENGEIDEGVMDAIRKVGRGVTQATGAVKGGLSKVGSAVKSAKQSALGGIAGMAGEKDTQAALQQKAAQTKAAGQQKARIKKAATVLNSSDKALRGAYTDLAKNAKALGLVDQPEVTQALGKVELAIGDVSRIIRNMTTTQAERNPPGVTDPIDMPQSAEE